MKKTMLIPALLAALTLTTSAAGDLPTPDQGDTIPTGPVVQAIPPAPVFVKSLHQGKTAQWWAARAVRARKEANRRAQLIRELRAKLARRLQSRDSLRAFAGDCLAAIIDHEGSGWRPTTWNTAGSGAYGLPQALPGSKMRSAGADWATNPYTQIRWMRGYTRSRYGGECSALAWWNGHGSY